jgi:ribosome biogenesis GTPase
METDDIRRMPGTIRARVVAAHKDRWELATQGASETNEAMPTPLGAVLSGRLRNELQGPADAPVVGDWVAAEWAPGDEAARIRAVEPRKGLLARKRPGDAEHDAVVEQPIAANVDLALLAMAVDDDFSVRRLERYFTLAWDSGAKPTVVLTKTDLSGTGDVPELETRLAEAASVAFGARILATSAKTGEGVAELRELLRPGLCAILLGSSGVGKSTLLNALAGADLQATAEVRDYDGKGRHTTTSRRLVALPWGAYLVDTPGVRELQLWGDEDSLAGSFPDIEELAVRCRFDDCVHETEPGCAVLEAVEAGTLDAGRLESWRRLRRELAYLERKTDAGAASAERAKWKSIAKQIKTMYRIKNR